MRFQCIGPRSKSTTRYQPQVEIDISPGRSQAGIENSGSEPFRPQAEMIPAQGGGRSKSDPGSRIIPASGRNDSGPGGRQVGVSVPDSGLGRNRFRPEAGAGARGEPGRRPPPPPVTGSSCDPAARAHPRRRRTRARHGARVLLLQQPPELDPSDWLPGTM